MKSLLTWIGVFFLGVYVSILGAVVHRLHGEVLGIVMPWGLLVAATTSSLLIAVFARHHLLGEVFVFGWVAALILTLGVIHRSYLIAMDAWGLSYLTIAFLALLTVLIRTPR